MSWRPSISGSLFALLMFGFGHGWIALVRGSSGSSWAMASYTLEQAMVWGVVLLIDDHLKGHASRFALAAAGTLWVSVTLISGFLMRMTSLPPRELVPMLLASEHVVAGLREIGLGPGRLLVLLVALLAMSAAGGLLHLRLDMLCAGVTRPRVPVAITCGLCLALPIAFALEQAHARQDDEYLRRAVSMPGYLQLYETSSASVVLPMPRPQNHDTRARWLARVGRAEKPRHVLYVLLESFRADAVTPSITPTMWQLSQEGTSFDAALAEATYTPLSWSVLLFDEAPQDNVFGRFPGRAEPLGSWLFAVMRQAGYELHASVSTNFDYGGMRRRMVGSGTPPLDFFQAAETGASGDPFDKNRNDQRAVDHLVRLIGRQHWDGAPQFLFLQLDSTHYTYPFPHDQAVFQPYSADLLLPKAIETEEQALLLRNRYWNAAHFVDAQLGRVIAALRTAGVYDDTVVVLTSDHGEGLRPGHQGHGPVYEATKRVPLIFKVPGQAPMHSQQLISHRDILPTLASYLGIALPPGSTRGCSAALGPSPAVFTLGPSGEFGQLTTPERWVDVTLSLAPDSVTVTPKAETCLASCTGEARPLDARDSQAWMPELASALRAERGRLGCAASTR